MLGEQKEKRIADVDDSRASSYLLRKTYKKKSTVLRYFVSTTLGQTSGTSVSKILSWVSEEGIDPEDVCFAWSERREKEL